MPLSAYLTRVLSDALPPAFDAALASGTWPREVNFALGAVNAVGLLNAVPILRDVHVQADGSFWDVAGCAAQLHITATLILPSVTMLLGSPTTISLALHGSFSAWIQTNDAGETVMTALSATDTALAPNPYAGGHAVISSAPLIFALDMPANAAASAALAGVLTPLMAGGMASPFANCVLRSVMNIPISLGTFSLCASRYALNIAGPGYLR
jgi:hypothetical protein